VELARQVALPVKMALLGKYFIVRIILFSQSAALPVYLFVSLFLNPLFFYLTIFQR